MQGTPMACPLLPQANPCLPLLSVLPSCLSGTTVSCTCCTCCFTCCLTSCVTHPVHSLFYVRFNAVSGTAFACRSTCCVMPCILSHMYCILYLACDSDAWLVSVMCIAVHKRAHQPNITNHPSHPIAQPQQAGNVCSHTLQGWAHQKVGEEALTGKAAKSGEPILGSHCVHTCWRLRCHLVTSPPFLLCPTAMCMVAQSEMYADSL